MTNQDVINFLNQVRKMLLDDKSWLESTIQPINEAFDKSISALQAQEAKHSTESSKTQKVLDTISRQAAIALADTLIHDLPDYERIADIVMAHNEGILEYQTKLSLLPSAQPTLYGYNVEHLILIASVLQKENLPPERITEALTDIGRVVAIVRDEFVDNLRKAVEKLPSAQPEPQWIPVSERLPEENDYKSCIECLDGAVWYCTENGTIGLGYYYKSTKEWSTTDDLKTDGKVVAWKPLPEPYRAERRTE